MAVTLNTPLILVDDEDLYRVSQENRAYRFEREANGAVTVSPNYTNGGRKSGKAFAQLLAMPNVSEDKPLTQARALPLVPASAPGLQMPHGSAKNASIP
jgi:hypothetical protein